MEFKEFLLEECIEKIIDHRGKTPKKLGGDWTKEGHPVISAKNVKRGTLKNMNSVRYISPEIYNKWMKEPLLFGDILLASEGATLGENTMWESNEKVALGQRLFAIRTDNSVLDYRYFSQYINSPHFQHQIFSRATGTSVLGIKQSELMKTKLLLPDIKIQQFIGKLAYAIQIKLSINTKIIANLEELSQTLFKRWFVDFEFPDENGNPYKSSGGTMIDSQHGKIPSTWKIVKLKDIVSQKKNSFNPKKSSEESVIHFSLPAFDNGQIPSHDMTKGIKSNKWIIEDNCTLFSKMNPSTMRVWLPNPESGFLNVASTEFIVLKSPDELRNSFIYALCSSQKFSDYLISNATGSTNSRQRVKPDKAMEFSMPLNPEIIDRLSKILNPMTKKILLLRNEIQSLTQLRDTLLPKLMSGEIELPDTLEVTEDAELLQRG